MAAVLGMCSSSRSEIEIFSNHGDVFAWRRDIVVLLIFVEPSNDNFSLRRPNTVVASRRLIAVIGNTLLSS